MIHTIVLARLVPHPFLRIPQKQAQALVWLNAGTATDAMAAQAYANKEGWRMFLYPVSEPHPLVRAKAHVLAYP